MIRSVPPKQTLPNPKKPLRIVVLFWHDVMTDFFTAYMRHCFPHHWIIPIEIKHTHDVIRWIKKGRIDAIITDWRDDFRGSLFKPYALQYGHNMKVIVCSSWGGDEPARDCVDKGVDLYMQLPVDVDYLRGRLQRLFSER